MLLLQAISPNRRRLTPPRRRTLLNSLSAQLPSLRAQVQLTEDLISTFRFQHDLTVLPGTLSLASSEALAELRDLERGLEATRTVYQSFLVRARRAAEEARVTRTGARIISVAYPPSAPSWPLRGLLVSLGAFAGFALGTSFALARDHFDQRLFTKRQVEERTGQPVLSVIPTLDLAKSGARHLHNGPFLRLLDAIRENSIGGPARVVLITSGGAAEGTSSLALNLSAAAADEGERVLLISDDSYIIRQASELLQASGMTYGAAGSNLSIRSIGRGRQADVRRELLAAVKGHSQAFDLVMLDCGAAPHDNRLRMMASFADAIVVVVRAGKTRVAEFANAMDMLGIAARRIVGIVLNRAGHR